MAWLNSDDFYIRSDVVSTAVEVLNRYPEVGVVFADFVEVDGDGELGRVYRRPRFLKRRWLLELNYVSQPTFFFRREILDRCPLDPDLGYAMDVDFLLRASQAGYGVAHYGLLAAAERVHGTAKCVMDRDAMAIEAWNVRLSHGARPGFRRRVTRFHAKLWLAAYGLTGIADLFRVECYLPMLKRGSLSTHLGRQLRILDSGLRRAGGK